MAKKIVLSTVRQQADVEVIYVNAGLICKVINAHNSLADIIDNAARYDIRQLTRSVLDENGEPCVDENGHKITEPDIDENGKQRVSYSRHTLDPEELRDLAEVVLPFLYELRSTLEGE